MEKEQPAKPNPSAASTTSRSRTANYTNFTKSVFLLSVHSPSANNPEIRMTINKESSVKFVSFVDTPLF